MTEKPHAPTLRAVAEELDRGIHVTDMAINLRAKADAIEREGHDEEMPHVAEWDRECAKRGHIPVAFEDGNRTIYRCVNCKRVFNDRACRLELRPVSTPSTSGGEGGGRRNGESPGQGSGESPVQDAGDMGVPAPPPASLAEAVWVAFHDACEGTGAAEKVSDHSRAHYVECMKVALASLGEKPSAETPTDRGAELWVHALVELMPSINEVRQYINSRRPAPSPTGETGAVGVWRRISSMGVASFSATRAHVETLRSSGDALCAEIDRLTAEVGRLQNELSEIANVAGQNIAHVSTVQAVRDLRDDEVLRSQEKTMAVGRAEAAEARLAEANKHLGLVLPLAKGWANLYPGGANKEIVAAADLFRNPSTPDIIDD